MRGHALFLASVLPACASAPVPWRADVQPALAEVRRQGGELVVYFALPGREQSDRMAASALRDPEVMRALDEGGFASLWVDGFSHVRLYAQWVGAGEGMGIAVLDAQGVPYAARPGPQDAAELAAFVRLCASSRAEVAVLRAAHAAAPADGVRAHALAVALLELGCRVGTDTLLVDAAQRGVLDAHHRLARLYALDGMVQRARQWLGAAIPSPARTVTEGYVLFKERRHADAIRLFERALHEGVQGSERLRARLYLGKALHEHGRDDAAKTILVALANEAPGTVFGASAVHTLAHFQDKTHDHAH